MSLSAMVWAFKWRVGSAGAKLVLLKLADNANDEGLCWPSLSTIAEAAECHRTSVIRHIKALEELGLVEVIHRVGEDGSNLSNHYQLRLDRRPQAVPSGSTGPGNGAVAPCDGVVASIDRGGRSMRGMVVAPCDPNQSLEPPIEPKSAARARAKAADAETLLPEDWWPDDDLDAYARDCGLDPRLTAANFRDYFHATGRRGPRRSAKGWRLSYQRWCREDAARKKTGKTPAIHRPGEAAATQSPREVAFSLLTTYLSGPDWRPGTRKIPAFHTMPDAEAISGIETFLREQGVGIPPAQAKALRAGAQASAGSPVLPLLGGG